MSATGKEILENLERLADYFRREGNDDQAAWLDRAADHIEFLETEMQVDAIDAVEYDDRKTLLDVFHDTKPGTVTVEGPLRDGLYDKLLAVARWGAQQALERMTEGREPAPEPCTAETHSWDHYRSTQIDSYWIRCTLHGEHDEHYDSNTGLRWRDTTEMPA